MTVGDLLEIINYYKEHYSEFEKYDVCLDISRPNDELPNLKTPRLYVNTDIGQVEFFVLDEE